MNIPIIFITETVVIRAHTTHLRAEVVRAVGSFHPTEIIEKVYSHIDDLHALPLRGLMNLALEFYEEIKKRLHTFHDESGQDEAAPNIGLMDGL